jgi:hypothetical protein
MTSKQMVAEHWTTRTDIEAPRRGDSESLPDDDQMPMAHDLGPGAASALRVAFGALVVFWGTETLTPVASAFVLSSSARPEDAWFTLAVGVVFLTSGVMTISNKLVPLAMTLLVPLSLHVLFQLAHV